MKIDLQKLARAQSFYASLGYLDVDVPWIVGDTSYAVTKPPTAGNLFELRDGNLVASGEQSFIELLCESVIEPAFLGSNGKAQCFTPCFRDEPVSNLNFKYFAKVELIDTDASQENLDNMLKDAQFFFGHYLDTDVAKTDIGYDIVANKTGIELGSYGIRSVYSATKQRTITFIYGTGCAEPRLSQAIEREKCLK